MEGEYTGHVKDGKLNGVGVCVYMDGSRYQGDWKQGLKSGRGTHSFASGARTRRRNSAAAAAAAASPRRAQFYRRPIRGRVGEWVDAWAGRVHVEDWRQIHR